MPGASPRTRACALLFPASAWHWTPARPCEALAGGAGAAGEPVSIVVYPGFRRSEIDAPRLVSAGFTHRRVLNSHMSLLLSTQVLFGVGGIAPRASAGLSFGVRKYR